MNFKIVKSWSDKWESNNHMCHAVRTHILTESGLNILISEYLDDGADVGQYDRARTFVCDSGGNVLDCMPVCMGQSTEDILFLHEVCSEEYFYSKYKKVLDRVNMSIN